MPPGLTTKNSSWCSKYVCVVYGSQNKQQLLPYRTLTYWFSVTEVEGVHCAVRSESLHLSYTFRLSRVNNGFLLQGRADEPMARGKFPCHAAFSAVPIIFISFARSVYLTAQYRCYQIILRVKNFYTKMGSREKF
jgi:hypothetical protein